MKWTLGILLVIIVVLGGLLFFWHESKAPTLPPGEATSTTGGFTEAALEDIVTVSAPLPSTTISSPLHITGKARGSWYFEATAPVELKDQNGTVIGHGTIRAQGDWTSADYVPFDGTLTFTAPATPTGTLVLKNDNPSGDPKKQEELDIPVKF